MDYLQDNPVAEDNITYIIYFESIVVDTEVIVWIVGSMKWTHININHDVFGVSLSK